MHHEMGCWAKSVLRPESGGADVSNFRRSLLLFLWRFICLLCILMPSRNFLIAQEFDNWSSGSGKCHPFPQVLAEFRDDSYDRSVCQIERSSANSVPSRLVNKYEPPIFAEERANAGRMPPRRNRNGDVLRKSSKCNSSAIWWLFWDEIQAGNVKPSNAKGVVLGLADRDIDSFI